MTPDEILRYCLEAMDGANERSTGLGLRAEPL